MAGSLTSPKGVLQALFRNLLLFPPVPGGAWRCQQLQCPSQWLPQALAVRSFQLSSCEVAWGDHAAAAHPACPPPLRASAVMVLPLQRGLWTCLAPCAADKGRRGSGEIPACAKSEAGLPFALQAVSSPQSTALAAGRGWDRPCRKGNLPFPQGSG